MYPDGLPISSVPRAGRVLHIPMFYPSFMTSVYFRTCFWEGSTNMAGCAEASYLQEPLAANSKPTFSDPEEHPHGAQTKKSSWAAQAWDKIVLESVTGYYEKNWKNIYA